VIRLQRNEDRSFSGLSLHVRFGPGEEIAQLKQLSGGQKALTALALIFAIQKCDPAPFYVFDEVDAALDCAHRARVGHFLAAQNSQFICTSFRKELVLVAEVHVGVNHSGKASHAEIVDAEHALDFIERE
jgi:structural maintenance of chromosome 3 (chondroitin sulfate proteoglycan 6)